MDAFDPTTQSMRSGQALAAGISRKRQRGPNWNHPYQGITRPKTASAAPELLRISDAVALLTGNCALGGWASLRVQGNTWFDGGSPGAGQQDILIHCGVGSQLRARPGIQPFEGLLYEDELISLEHYEVSTMARAVYDEMRMARGWRNAVAALDMAISTTALTPHTTLARVARVIDSHHKTRGLVQARKALGFASSRSASPWETRTRLIAQVDAGIAGLMVNAPVFDRYGTLLGIADLLDPLTGLVIESDGADHRAIAAHSGDNIREEKFERALMVVVRVTSIEHADRIAIAARIRAAQRDARRTPHDRWTLEKPDWWWSWPPARRWA